VTLSAWRVQIRPEVSFARKLLRVLTKWANEDSNGEKTDGSDVDTETRCARAVRGRLRAENVDEKEDAMSVQLALRSARRSGRAVGRAARKGDERNP